MLRRRSSWVDSIASWAEAGRACGALKILLSYYIRRRRQFTRKNQQRGREKEIERQKIRGSTDRMMKVENIQKRPKCNYSNAGQGIVGKCIFKVPHHAVVSTRLNSSPGE